MIGEGPETATFSGFLVISGHFCPKTRSNVRLRVIGPEGGKCHKTRKLVVFSGFYGSKTDQESLLSAL